VLSGEKTTFAVVQLGHVRDTAPITEGKSMPINQDILDKIILKH